MPQLVVVLFILSSCLAALAVSADEPASPPRPVGNAVERAGPWKMATLKRKDGQTFHGFVQSRSEREIEFVEIVRPAGKPMYLVVHAYQPRLVESVSGLSTEEQAELVSRIGKFLELKSRARIEAQRMDDLTLRREERDGETRQVYDGPHFRLLSTADEETTRRCAVRIDQVFRAYRLLLPPRGAVNGGPPELLLLGSMDEYLGYLQRLKQRGGPDVSAPAFYFPARKLIVAGSDLTRYAELVRQTRAQNQRLLDHYAQLARDLPKRLKLLTDEMRQQGFTPDEIESEIELRRAAWSREQKGIVKQVDELNRRNDTKFADVTGRMFTRLYHEAFHAYVDTSVCPDTSHELPRWLNEGLAQILENGQLDGDALRIDAPARETLRELQADLRGDQPLSLAHLLAAESQAFLATHADGSSRRHYVYSWGLAYYLTFHENLLAGDALDHFSSRESGGLSPTARFEKLVGMPLPAFERRWRETLLALKPPAR